MKMNVMPNGKDAILTRVRQVKDAELPSVIVSRSVTIVVNPIVVLSVAS